MSTITFPYSILFTWPLIIWPTLSLNSSYCLDLSASRTFWTIVCFADWAAILPKSKGGKGSKITSPIWIPGLMVAASLRRISIKWFSIFSTTVLHLFIDNSPVLISILAWMSYSEPYFDFAAFAKLSSIASITRWGSINFSLATASAIWRSSLLFVLNSDIIKPIINNLN